MPRNSVTRFINNHFVDCNARSAFTEEGYSNLRTFFGNVEKGQQKVFHTKFAKGTDTERLLEEWFTILESISKKWPSLWKFEKDLATKVGPLSVMKPLNERLEDVAHYWDDILLSSEPVSEKAVRSVLREFQRARGLRIRSEVDTMAKMKKSTNSGSPFWTKRRTVRRQTLGSTIFTDMGRGPEVCQFMKDGTVYGAPAVIGWRGQEGGPSDSDVKQRVVWMFPFAVNLAELQVYQPLIEAFQRHNIVSPWVSNDAVDERITKLFDSKSSDDLIVSTDFTRFDQHFNSDLQDCAESILKGILTPTGIAEEWFRRVFPAKYFIRLIWQVNEETFSAFEGRHGMGSGSGGTNADETLVHRALQYEAAQSKSMLLNPNSMCLGDDGILSYPGITVEDVVASYEAHGQECNETKQYAASDNCIFLRRWHHANYRLEGRCVGVYSTARALGRMRYLERRMSDEFYDDPGIMNLRYLSILENCKWHPLREQFVKFCMERDEYKLGLNIPGFFDNIERIAERATSVMPDFLGYTKTMQGETFRGISQWWIVQYLKSLA